VHNLPIPLFTLSRNLAALPRWIVTHCTRQDLELGWIIQRMSQQRLISSVNFLFRNSDSCSTFSNKFWETWILFTRISQEPARLKSYKAHIFSIPQMLINSFVRFCIPKTLQSAECDCTKLHHTFWSLAVVLELLLCSILILCFAGYVRRKTT